MGTGRSWFSPRVIRETERLPDAVCREAQDLIPELAVDPYPPESLKLRKSRNSRRIRFYRGSHPNRRNHVALYRLIYEVFDATGTVRILRIAYRDEITYSGFDRW